MNESIYQKIEIAKNGTKIPLLKSGKTLESRYNPERDAETLCNSLDTAARFFLVLGIGSGIFINKLLEKYKDCFIIGLEIYQNDIDFLNQLEAVKEAAKQTNVRFCTLETLFDTLTNNYLPGKFGDLKILEQRVWLAENQNHIDEIKYIINHAVGIISADYSVQAHFGKIWMKNILQNSLLAEKTCNRLPELSTTEKAKTALIVAAGPSLEKSINLFKDKIINRDELYIIATDTAFSTLNKKGIESDAVISIDGQNVSYNHFIKAYEQTSQAAKYDKTRFFFDLCANHSAAKKLFESNFQLSFFCSGHPLSSAINNSNNNSLPYLFSGAGTVTITALDFAIKSGFTKIKILGADFAYLNGKAYTYGTYLESLYKKAANHILNFETLFDKLMFRTPLTEKADRKTTQVLEAYKESLNTYLTQNNASFRIENDVYIINLENNTNPVLQKNTTFKLSNFLEKFKSSKAEETEIILLPYIAWLKNNKKFKDESYSNLLKLAFNTIVSYNI